MSRFYEALQRAERERLTTTMPEENSVSDSAESPFIEALAPAKPERELDFDHIAQHQWTPSLDTFPTMDDRGPVLEQFRGLRSRMYQARYESPLKTVLISSGVPSEGKSFVAANLAVSLARNGVNNILLIDCDLRRPTLHNLFGAPNTIGLSEYLAGSAAMEEIIQRGSSVRPAGIGSVINLPNLALITAGKCGDNSSELVANHRMEELIAGISTHFDWILIDSPPVMAVTDAVDIARVADAVLLVLRGGKTSYDVVQRTQSTFSSSRILGFVLNDMKDAPRRGYYSYYYGEGEEGGEAKEVPAVKRKK